MKKANKTNPNHLIYYLIIITLFFSLRIPALNQEVFGDEFYYYHYSHHEVSMNDGVGDYSYVYFIPIIFYKIGYLITQDIVGVRLISLLFSLINISLGLIYLRKYFGTKPSIIFGLIYSLLPWTVFSSILLDNDATIITALVIILIWITTHIIKNDAKPFYYLIFGLISGILIFLKFIIMAPLILVGFITINYILFKNNHNFKKIKTYVRYNLHILIGTVISLVFLSATYSLVFGITVLKKMISHYTNQSVGISSGLTISFIFQFFLPLIFISPIIFIIILALFEKFDKKSLAEKYMVFSILSLLSFFIFATYLNNYLTLNRYLFIIVIPSLFILSIYLAQLSDTPHFLKICTISIMGSSLLFIPHLLKNNILDFYPKINWFIEFIKLRWNFLFPINASNGPIGFYISFISMIIPFAIASALFTIILIKMLKKRPKTNLIIGIIIVSLAYSTYMSIQYTYTPYGPSISETNKEIRELSQNHDSYYIFRNNAGFFAQNNQKYENIIKIDFEDEFNQQKIDQIIQSKKTIFIIDFPQINKQSNLWENLNSNCSFIKSYPNKEYNLSYVYIC